ncbi:hypothetical protein [Aeromonas veronii]|uniref:hypothetical protein n=1 Tax=Aeromonas veronii TaxID=654 RepID=UPI0024176750|nr:hypothetical protein [Aeromonas veronii]WFO49756.1 hypothetical protein L1O00_11980 [Aeromonas veronii]
MLISEKIDDLIEKQYATMTSTSGKGELAQLSRLFSKDFVDGLAKIIYENDSANHSLMRAVTVELNYIDKQPYARYFNENNIVPHGELADALFIYRDGWGSLDKNGEIIHCGITSDRALFFQAKLNTSNNIPKVPIRTGYSTDKEFKLLSLWQKFDLVKKPANKATLLNDVDVHSQNTNVLSLGWFGACAPTHNKVWDSRWMCGEAKKDTSCSTTLGNLLANLYQGNKINGIEIGRTFDSNAKIVNQNSGWDDLINATVKLSKESPSPTILAKYCSSRHRSSTALLHLIKSNHGKIMGLARIIYEDLNYGQPYGLYELPSLIEWMFEDKKLNLVERLTLHKTIIDVVISVINNLESQKITMTFSDVLDLVEEFIYTSANEVNQNNFYNYTEADDKLNLNENGMFILTATVIRAEERHNN